MAIDEHSRVALASVAANECSDTATPFLESAVAHFQQRGVRIERVITGNGSACLSHAFRDACCKPRIRLRTKPYTPRTNGKAERFIQSCLREWAYAEAKSTSEQRTTAHAHWLHDYTSRRPHTALKNLKAAHQLPHPEGRNLFRLHS